MIGKEAFRCPLPVFWLAILVGVILMGTMLANTRWKEEPQAMNLTIVATLDENGLYAVQSVEATMIPHKEMQTEIWVPDYNKVMLPQRRYINSTDGFNDTVDYNQVSYYWGDC